MALDSKPGMIWRLICLHKTKGFADNVGKKGMIIPTREASKIQQIHTLLVDHGFRISVGRGVIGFCKYTKNS